MKNGRRIAALFLVLTLLLSCVGAVHAAERPGKAEADRSAAQEEPTPGAVSEALLTGREDLEPLAHRFADDEMVRAIVLLDGKPAAEIAQRGTAQANAQEARLLADHDAIYRQMSALRYTRGADFTALFDGFSCDISFGDLDELQQIAGVKKVYLANRYAAPETAPAEDEPAVPNVMMGNRFAQDNDYAGQGTVIAILDTGVRVTHEAFQDGDGKMAEYGRLKQSDLVLASAKGAYVNAKVPFAYDYADRDTDVNSAEGHGTHVAGIAAGNAYDKEEGAYTFVGAAPYAQILAMKIFSDTSASTTSDIYFLAIEDAYRLGADVINMSIGAVNGFSYDDSLETEIFGNIYRRLSAAGVLLTISGGNSYSMADTALPGYIGPEYTDYGTVSSPAAFDDNVSIASVESGVYADYALVIDGENYSFTDASDEMLWRGAFSGRAEIPFVVIPDGAGGISLGAEADYQNVDVTDKIAVVKRGTIDFQTKVNNAAAAGAVGCIVVNSEPGTIYMSVSPYPIPAISVAQDMEEVFLRSESQKVLTSEDMVPVKNAAGWQMSDFSSWGPSPTLTIDPELSAVGGRVYSSYNTADDAYEVLDGTSMAAPNAAGTFANVLSYLTQETSLRGAARARRARQILEGSATLLTDFDDYLFSVRRQGAGLANAQKAIETYAQLGYLDKTVYELGDDAKKDGVYSFDVTLRNDGKQDAHYSSVEAYVMTDAIANIGTEEQPVQANQLCSEYLYAGSEGDATVTYTLGGKPVESFDVPAGGSVTVHVSIALSAEAKAALDETFENGAYIEGYVVFHGAGEDVCYYERFVDCTEAWYHEAVDFVANRGWMLGTATDRFSPDDPLTRAMVATVLYRIAGEPETADAAAFPDVAPGQYYTEAVAWAKSVGIIGGYEDGTFRPENRITREEMAVMLARYARLIEHKDTTPKGDLSAYPDAGSVSPYAREDLIWCVDQGIVNGSDGKLLPQDNATRAQFAAILSRYFGDRSDEAQALHATFLAYYGDWTKAPVLDYADFRDYLNAEHALYEMDPAPEGVTATDLLDCYTGVSYAYTARMADFSSGRLFNYLGNNVLSEMGEHPFYESHMAFSTPRYDGEYAYADMIYMEPMLLRNVSKLTMTVTDSKTGRQIRQDTVDYVAKNVYSFDYSQWMPTAGFYWDGTDATGRYVDSGTVAHVQFDAVLPYRDTVVEDVWSFDVTVDYTAPVIDEIDYDIATDTLTVTASDENYLQAIFLYDLVNGEEIAAKTYSSEKAGETFTAQFDVADYRGEEIVVAALDYATNAAQEEYVLVESGVPATITLVTPDGKEEHQLSTGRRFTFPECKTADTDSCRFLFWTPVNLTHIDEARFDLIPEADRHEPGSRITVSRDETFYALWEVGSVQTLDRTHYYVVSSPETFAGDWAIVGLPVYDGTYFMTDEPQALTANLTILDVEMAENTTVGDVYAEFFTNEPNIRFTFEPSEGGSYVIRNTDTKQCLALSGSNLAMVSDVTDSARWYVSQARTGNSVLIYNVAAQNMVLLYNNDAGRFEVFDDRTPVSDGRLPSSYYYLWLYRAADEEFVADYYTTVRGSVEPPVKQTVTLHTPAGTDERQVEDSDLFELPECDEVYEGYQFEGWVRNEVESVESIDGLTVAAPGSLVSVNGPMHFYALYAKGEIQTLEQPLYSYRNVAQQKDFSGDWALSGAVVYGEPYALGENANTLFVQEDLENARVEQDSSKMEPHDFWTENETVHFVLRPVADKEGYYTIQNAKNSKYLALDEQKAVVMTDTADEAAQWNVYAHARGYGDVLIFNAKYPNMLFNFDDAARQFRIFDDTVPVDFYGAKVKPSSYYSMYLYTRITEMFLPASYTTQIELEPTPAYKYTVTLVTPGETKVYHLNDDSDFMPGGSLKLPDCMETYEGFTFVGWTDKTVEKATSAPTHLTAGQTVYVDEEQPEVTYYALFSAFHGAPLETPKYVQATESELAKLADFSGEWTPVGLAALNYQYILTTDGASQKVDDLPDTTSTGSSFETKDERASFRFAKSGDAYTIQQGDKYLALGAENTIAFVDSVTEQAKWTVSVNPKDKAQVLIFNVSNPNMLLRFNKDAKTFQILDDTVEIEGEFSWLPKVKPSEHDGYNLYYYRCEREATVVDYYTTEIALAEQYKYVVTLITPNGEKRYGVNDEYTSMPGGYFTFPDCEDRFDGYDFAGWTDQETNGDTAPAVCEPAGKQISVSQSATYYALYTKSHVAELETPNYVKETERELAALEDFSGEWTPVGEDRFNDQYILTVEGNSQKVADLEETTRERDRFETKNTNARITVKKDGESYTLQLNGEKYLALGEGNTITFVDEVTPAAKWNISINPSDKAQVLIFNAEKTDMLLRFNKDEMTFQILDNTVKIEGEYSWDPDLPPSEHSGYNLYYYRCELTGIVIDLYTTNPA